MANASKDPMPVCGTMTYTSFFTMNDEHGAYIKKWVRPTAFAENHLKELKSLAKDFEAVVPNETIAGFPSTLLRSGFRLVGWRLTSDRMTDFGVSGRNVLR
jgi:hypothetical protein